MACCGRVAILVFVCTLVAIEARPGEVLDTIKHAYNVAYDGVHCGFHKVKGLVVEHQHQSGQDPCKDKPSSSVSTTPNPQKLPETINPSMEIDLREFPATTSLPYEMIDNINRQ